MKVQIAEKRSGPTPAKVLELVQQRETEQLLEDVRSVIDRSGKYHQSGRLRAGLHMVRTSTGANLMAPPDRLRQVGPRQGFIDVLRTFLRSVR